MNRLRCLFLILFLICGVSRAGAQADTLVRLGSIENNVYSHAFFKLQVTLPKWWEPLPGEALLRAIREQEAGIDSLPAEERDVLLAEFRHAAMLLLAFRFTPGRDVPFNASIMLTSQYNMRSDTANLSRYAENFIRNSPTVNPVKTFSGPAERVVINGQPFYRIDSVISSPGTPRCYQRNYLTSIYNYYIDFTLTYETGSEEKTLEEAMKTVKVGW